ncbi:MAG: hypothetical protein KIS92_22435 [Planctomycetota bacterium]|nr:hypothetical protein [Planctomycetota bacterium]
MDLVVVIQIILGVLITICMALVGWALASVVKLMTEHSSEKARNEQREVDLNRRFSEHRDHFNERLTQVQSTTAFQFSELQKADARIEQSVTALHKRLDNALENSAKGN